MQIKMQWGGGEKVNWISQLSTGGGCEEVNGISQLSMENVHT